jgi:hypothetical protein
MDRRVLAYEPIPPLYKPANTPYQLQSGLPSRFLGILENESGRSNEQPKQLEPGNY